MRAAPWPLKPDGASTPHDVSCSPVSVLDLAEPPSSASEGAECAVALLLERCQAERQAEVEELMTRRCVTADREAECPICLCPFEERRYPECRVPQGAFSGCAHAVCRECCTRLLITAADSVATVLSHEYRCPMCRAAGVAACDAPPWLRTLIASDDVAAARQAAKRRAEDSAPIAVRRAAATAAENIAALRRIVLGASGAGVPFGDSERLQRAIRAASSVLVEVEEDEDGTEGEVEDEGPVFTRTEGEAELGRQVEVARRGDGSLRETPPSTELMSDDELRLMADAEDEALFGGEPGSRVDAFMAQVARALFESDVAAAEASMLARMDGFGARERERPTDEPPPLQFAMQFDPVD